MPLYALRMWKEDIELKEHQDMKWVKATDLYDYEMPAADIPLISQLIDYL